MKMENKEERMKDGWATLGTFGVDSGQFIITDPCYLDEFKDDEYDEEKIKKFQEKEDYPFTYNGTCARTMKDKKRGGSIHHGCATVGGTGWGDGTYTVRARYEEGRIMEINVKFD